MGIDGLGEETNKKAVWVEAEASGSQTDRSRVPAAVKKPARPTVRRAEPWRGAACSLPGRHISLQLYIMSFCATLHTESDHHQP